MRNIGKCWKMRCLAGMYEESKECKTYVLLYTVGRKL